jgi:hypothetical protein
VKGVEWLERKRLTDAGHLEPVKFVATSLFLPFA